MTRDGSHRPIRPATPGAGRSTDRGEWLLGVTAAVLVALAATILGGAWAPTRLTGAGYVMVLHTHDGTALDPAVRILRDRLGAAGYQGVRVGVAGDRVTIQVGNGPDSAGLRLLAAPGRLSFRAVLAGPVLPTPAGAYRLDAPAVGSADIATVSAELVPAGWSVRIGFTPAGRTRWRALTEAARQSPVSRQIAIVVDQRIVTAPWIDQPAPDTALVTRPADDQRQVVELAALLRFGPLPVAFTVERVSAQ
jgi:preprotein translocase subunit SecD